MSETAAAVAHDAAHDSPEEIRKHVKGYWIVGGMLYVGTALTVAVALLELPVHLAILVALLIAATKASLVALYFMHLISEKKLIYWTLALVAGFFALCLLLPTFTVSEGVGTPTNQEITAQHLQPTEHAAEGK